MFFNNKKATTIFGAKAHRKLKLFGVVEWLVKNHKKTINTPRIPLIKKLIKLIMEIEEQKNIWMLTIVSNIQPNLF